MFSSFHFVLPVRVYSRKGVNCTRRMLNITKVVNQLKEFSNLSFEDDLMSPLSHYTLFKYSTPFFVSASVAKSKIMISASKLLSTIFKFKTISSWHWPMRAAFNRFYNVLEIKWMTSNLHLTRLDYSSS